MTEEVEKKISGLIPVAVKLPVDLVSAIDRVVATGRYANRSEFVRAAIRTLLDKEGKR